MTKQLYSRVQESTAHPCDWGGGYKKCPKNCLCQAAARGFLMVAVRTIKYLI